MIALIRLGHGVVEHFIRSMRVSQVYRIFSGLVVIGRVYLVLQLP